MSKKSKKQLETQALQRAAVILRVQTGQITATEGAQELGISRKSYYKWEKRGLKALLASLQEKPTGRPASEKDPQKQQQQQDIRNLEQKNGVLNARLAIQKAVFQVHKDKKKGQKKPKRS